MQEVKTEITIQAPIEKVWSILTDFQSYPTWNPFMTQVNGKFGLNENLQVTIVPPNQKPMKFKPRIIAMKQYEFHWLGKFLVSGLFDGRHSFCLLPTTQNSVTFKHYEVFSGILHKPLFKLINEATHSGFEEMNRALKKHCEEWV